MEEKVNVDECKAPATVVQKVERLADMTRLAENQSEDIAVFLGKEPTGKLAGMGQDDPPIDRHMGYAEQHLNDLTVNLRLIADFLGVDQGYAESKRSKKS